MESYGDVEDMSAADAATPIRVLFIEDDDDVARQVRARLSASEGDRMVVHHMHDLKAGLIALNGDGYDVVLTDLNLSDSQGVRTVKRLVAVRKEIPVVVFSAVDEERAILELLHSGAQEYIIKGHGDGHGVARALRQAIERKRAELNLQRLAHYDSLTGLANRTLFHNRLEYALANATRRQSCVALMVLDLDRFKAVNDTLGHQAGDRLLTLAAERLGHCVRESDTIARLGGDEFTIILENLGGADEPRVVARKILDVMAKPFVLEGQDVYVTPSIGITLFPYDDDNVDGLLKNADAAMYQVKANGRNGYQFFTAGMNERAVERIRIESGLRQAIDRNEFVLHYQPKVNLQSGRMQGVEALVRWQRPGAGTVSPAEFIPVAEDTGLIIPIGEWVLRKALAQTRIWVDNGLPVCRLAVNICARQFRQGDVAAMISDALRQSGLDGSYLEVEITESVLMEDTDATVVTLQRLKELGVSIAIDDFGTGYSSLNYLKRFPIDTLKIDRSFVSDIPYDQDDAVITRAIIGLAHNLRRSVIAEGVETHEQVRFLRENDCDEAQGYLFSAPINTMQMTGYLERERGRAAAGPLLTVIGGGQVAV
jgi:diguanylate cyclase (GGDEF)-like protein